MNLLMIPKIEDAYNFSFINSRIQVNPTPTNAPKLRFMKKKNTFFACTPYSAVCYFRGQVAYGTWYVVLFMPCQL